VYQDVGGFFRTEQTAIRRTQMLNPYIEAWQVHDLIEKKEVKLREVAEFFNLRIEKLNPKLGAFMTATPERAMADVARLEKATAAEISKMPLYGIPYSLKDLTWTKDIKTTMGSKKYENYMPPVDAEITVRMRNAGGILLGKTATLEFGGRHFAGGPLETRTPDPLIKSLTRARKRVAFVGSFVTYDSIC